MALAALETLLKNSMGLNAVSIGSRAIARAVQERLLVCKLKDLSAYVALVRGSGTELQALIEAVVVPETWFFRDRHAFTTLARHAHDEWLPAHPDGVLSLLSLPCSTGEEPYSMAMALLDAGVPASRFRVDAVDISARNIAQGTRGVYGKNSFRGQDLAFRDAHFDLVADGYQLRDAVRRQVHFQQGNFFAAALLPGVGIYEVIFCRNVLIYFDRPTQDRALTVLNRLLAAKGMLFVAPAETSLPADHGLTSTNEPLAFAFRKARASLPASKGISASPLNGPRRPALPVGLVLHPARVTPAALAVAARTSLPPMRLAEPPADLNLARRLADQGHFVEAARCCEEYLRKSGPSATAFYLMGLVRDATGSHADAATFYRKALYLDPNHYDTQIHFALLMEKQGDTGGAQVMRSRARRLELKGKASHE